MANQHSFTATQAALIALEMGRLCHQYVRDSSDQLRLITDLQNEQGRLLKEVQRLNDELEVLREERSELIRRINPPRRGSRKTHP